MEHGLTRRSLLVRLLRGPDTASHLADAVGVDTAAARRHLEALAEEGFVTAVFRQEGVGRPKKYYEISPQGRESLPRRYDLLAQLMAQAVARRGGDPVLGEVMASMAEELAGTEGRRVPKGAPVRERVRAVAGILRDLGFPTDVEERDGRLVIVRRDCVFLQVARAHRDAVCERLDTRFLSLLLGESVELVACIPDGDGACRHEVRPRSASRAKS